MDDVFFTFKPHCRERIEVDGTQYECLLSGKHDNHEAIVKLNKVLWSGNNSVQLIETKATVTWSNTLSEPKPEYSGSRRGKIYSEHPFFIEVPLKRNYPNLGIEAIE